MTDSEIIKILSEAWSAAEGTVQARLTRQEKSAVEMWLDGVALEAATQEVYEIKKMAKEEEE